jgi:1-acyl-sn-glycerol-3-phosphate acyltransferase
MKQYHAEIEAIAAAVNRFFRRSFTRVEINGPALDPADYAEASLMVACTHRSQLDYFVVGYVLNQMAIKNMRFAAGENLTSLPVIGPVFRDFGAFTVRRGSTFGRDYVRGLCEQVVSMLHDGDTIVVFPEGGRSYEGEMLEVRGGIIGAAVLAQRRNPARPAYLMPMSISYERLPELHAFPGLLEGKSMRRPGQGWRRRLVGSIKYYGADALAFIKLLYAHYFGVKYGVIFVDYGEPISIASLYNPDTDITEGARDDFSACRLAFQSVSLRVFDLFNGLYRILPVHVLAAAVADRPGATLQEAREGCLAILERLRGLGRNVSSVGAMDPDQLLNTGIVQLRMQKGIWVRGNRLRVRSRQVVRYYAAATE